MRLSKLYNVNPYAGKGASSHSDGSHLIHTNNIFE